MNMEKVAQGFELVVENITKLSEKLDTDFYDAFVEQNAAFLDGTDQGIVELSVNNDKLRQLNLSNKEWQKLFQFVLLKGSQVAPLRAHNLRRPERLSPHS
ncbi:class I SAM-dependent methyltransferase, partial [Citrobacter sp. TBCS-11]